MDIDYLTSRSKMTLANYLNPFIEVFNSYSFRICQKTYTLTDIQRVLNEVDSKAPELLTFPKYAYLLADTTDENNPIRKVASDIALVRDTWVVAKILQSHEGGLSQFVMYGTSHVSVWLQYMQSFYGS